jgi:pimeloyl-ACP methyl ester carboxylesterase
MSGTPAKEGAIKLKDGRLLGYAEYGDVAGRPVLYFPGAPSSRLFHPPDEATTSLGVHLIVMERPGYGLSDFQRGRSLVDWPLDVTAFADVLGLDRFPVVGVSAGGPYAAACAARIPERVTRAAILGGVGPADVPGALQDLPRIRRAGAAIARNAPWLLPAILWLVANPNRGPENFFRKMISGNSPVDREVLSRPEMKAALTENFREAMRQGVRGFAQDAVILSRPWGFRLEDISIPVHLWHGEEDANVSLSAARAVARAIPNCRATFLPGEGHWLFLEHWKEILERLLA